MYVLGTPDIPTGEVRIYLDLEGAPDDGFVYLIGTIICEGATQMAYWFWADTKDRETSIFEEFLAVVARYHNPRVYAYGGYERAFLKRMRRNSTRKKLGDRIVDRVVNVLGIIYTDSYFPHTATASKKSAASEAAHGPTNTLRASKAFLAAPLGNQSGRDVEGEVTNVQQEGLHRIAHRHGVFADTQTVLVSDFYAAHDARSSQQLTNTV